LRRFLVPVLAVTGAVLVAFRLTSRPVGNTRVPEPAKPVDLERYAGRWYEFARYDVGFERNCEGVTADYAMRPDGLISVVNACRMGGPAGAERSVKGKAKVVEGSNNAKLRVSFFGPFYLGNYWVLDHAVDYTWAIVGEPGGTYLWILTREVTPSNATRHMLIERTRALGYDVDMLRMTGQPPG
jgi:apolipoprotein D and lipocalin family protein